jgi:GNAT superfamily N-acetyltransferase
LEGQAGTNVELRNENVTIRPAVREDAGAIAEMLAASAEAQGAADRLCVRVDTLIRDGFGDNPRFHALVAESDSRLVALALYFFTYSTWVSPNGLYLEDLYVDPSWRRRGIARALMRELGRIAVRADCRRFQWSVLRANRHALGFYKSLGAETADDWLLMQWPSDVLPR